MNETGKISCTGKISYTGKRGQINEKFLDHHIDFRFQSNGMDCYETF